MAYIKSAKKPIPTALALGTLGGATLILITIATIEGVAILIAYTALIIATFAVLRAVRWSSFFKRFITSFLTFMIATIFLHLYIGIFATGKLLEMPVWGHIWRLGVMALIGGILSFSVAYIANINR